MKAKRTIYTALGGLCAVWFLFGVLVNGPAAGNRNYLQTGISYLLLCAAVLFFRSAWRIACTLKKRSRDHIGDYL